MNPGTQKSTVTYLDYAASAPPVDGMFERWEKLSQNCFANPHGTTKFSAACKVMLHNARRQILTALEIPPAEADVLWTSGGTEAINLAIHGILSAQDRSGVCLLDSTAHAATLEAAHAFSLQTGTSCPPLSVMPDGSLILPELMNTAVKLAAVTHINNETGVIRNIVDVRQALNKTEGTRILLVDALQSAGKIAIPWTEARIDLLAVGGRKVGGPASIGALIVRKGITLRPLFFGGGQQEGIRPGTVDVPAAALFAEILTAEAKNIRENQKKMSALREKMLQGLQKLEKFNASVISPLSASPYITCVSFPEFEGAVIMRLLAEQGVVIGSGSACSAEAGKPSHVLKAMGCSEKISGGALRISFGPKSTGKDVNIFLSELEKILTDY